MNNSTVAALLSAIPDLRDLVEVLTLLLPLARQLFAALRSFRQQPLTPARTHAFEIELARIARASARIVVQHEYHRIEPECLADLADCPLRLHLAGQEYRRRPKSRNVIGTLFGEIELRRYLYECVEPGEKAIFPLEMQLGIEAGLATPALAERVAGCGGWITSKNPSSTCCDASTRFLGRSRVYAKS